jgi:hypothetical protein
MIKARKGYDRLCIWDNSTVKYTSQFVKDFVEMDNKAKRMGGDGNIGKAKAMNNMFNETERLMLKTIKPPLHFAMCHVDSDMIVDEDTLERGFDLLESFEEDVIIAANHKGNNHHKFRGTQRIKKNGETLTPVRLGKGVAGGCLWFTNKVFDEIGGYREDRGIYGGNEGSLFERFHNRGKGILVANAIHVFHPEDDDEGYAKWKEDCQENLRSGLINTERGYYG